MDVLQQTLNKVLATLPAVTLEKLIARKLRAQGARFPKTLPAKIAQHILSGSPEPFHFDGRALPSDISLSFNKADGDELVRAIDSFLETELPVMVTAHAERFSKKILKDLKGNWAEEQRLQLADLSGFRSRMEETWGKPFSKLRMLLTIAREWCGEAHQEPPETGAHDKSRLQKLMVRFLVRSCQVTGEIVCLLENGFADGAMARWRTLHEIGVVAAVISKHGEDIAERYHAHQAVESKRAMSKYLDCYEQLGYKRLAAGTITKVEKAYNAAIARYGQSFKSDYGWAAHHLKNARPTFADIEAEAGYAEMRAHYQMGNDNVHAGVKSMYMRLGLMTDHETLLAGHSNAGLTDPGQNAAHTLTQIAVLVCLSPKLDDLIAALLRDEIPSSFWEADRGLRRKHKAFIESKVKS
jgi:hypothetical protein